MSCHLPRTLIGETLIAWCNVCSKDTKHRVDAVDASHTAGKIGPCVEHGPKTKDPTGRSQRQVKQAEQREAAQRQPSLFAEQP